MTLIVPGVEVKVVKDVLTPQLAPSGVLGLIAVTEIQPPGGVGRAASWNSFAESFGAASAFSAPEATQALANGVFELVVSAVDAATTTAASIDIPADAGGGKAFTLTARAGGIWANGLVVTIELRSIATSKDDGTADTPIKVFDLTVQRPGGSDVETFRNLSMDAASPRYVGTVVSLQSQIVTVTDIDKKKGPKGSDDKTPYLLAGGKDAGRADYQAALDKLVNEPDVDMVLVSVQDVSNLPRLAQIYADLIAHCDRMSTRSQGRVAFAGVPGSTEALIRTNSATLVNSLVSDRLMLVAPFNTVGAVAGMVGSLDFFQSPTFKRLALGGVSPAIGVESQQELLQENVVPIVAQRGRGVIVVRGLTTDGDQVSVRRVADRAVRGVKTIGEQFIGRLNNELGRGALKQNLIGFLVQMEKDGAIVPSTDGKDPAFKVNVYSSQADFAQGIVRVDMAVRPVRAIDYIYATVLVQV
jgi:hypothetical protein